MTQNEKKALMALNNGPMKNWRKRTLNIFHGFGGVSFLHGNRCKLVMAKTLWWSDVLFDLRINCLHPSAEWRVEIHAIIRLTTSCGGVLGTMAGVEQLSKSNKSIE